MITSEIRAGDVLRYEPHEPWLTLRRGEECIVLYLYGRGSVRVEFADTTKWLVRATDLTRRDEEPPSDEDSGEAASERRLRGDTNAHSACMEWWPIRT